MRKVERIDPLQVDALQLRDCLISALAGEKAIALAPISEEFVPDNHALLIETGGSTGAPKIVALSAAAMRASSRLSNQVLGANQGDRWSLSLPLNHIAGINQLLRAIDLGSDPVPTGGEYISIVPTQLYRALRNRDALFDQLISAKRVLIGGAAVPEQLLSAGRSTGIPLVVSYGMTEMCGGCIYDGVPLPGVEVRIGSDEKISLKGPMRAEGYFNNVHTTNEVFIDSWFITNDFGKIGSDGRLEVRGRADDIIISGGEKISPTAITELLRSHFPRTELLLLGIPDQEWGQSLRLIATKSDETDALTLKVAREIVATTFGKVAAPRSLLLLSELPTKENGKVDLQHLIDAIPTETL